MAGLRRAVLAALSVVLASGTAVSVEATTASATTAVTANSFNSSFSTMSQLKSLAKAGKGKVGVLLPDTQSSARYVDFDAPYLTRAFQAAGLSSSQFTIDNAQNSDATQQTQAEALITNGASVLLLDPLDSGVGAAIEQYAQPRGVKVIDYDRLVLGGSGSYYVSFNNVTVGNLIGKGEVSCISAWHVNKPKVFELDGSPTDNNATLFAQGYNAILQKYYKAKTYQKVGEQAVPKWDNQQALTIFQQQYTAHPNINAVVTANDGLGNSVVAALKSANIPPKKIPTTGQDATLQGMVNVLDGYQCMSVYKPIYLEAQAAVALALYTRANKTPPSGLVNAKVTDTTGHRAVSSSLLTPVSVTSANMASTVIKDGFISSAALCAQVGASVCSRNGIH